MPKSSILKSARTPAGGTTVPTMTNRRVVLKSRPTGEPKLIGRASWNGLTVALVGDCGSAQSELSDRTVACKNYAAVKNYAA